MAPIEKNLGVRVVCLNPVAKPGREKPRRRAPATGSRFGAGGRQDLGRPVFDTIDVLAVGAVVPLVSDHPRMCWIAPGRKRGVAGSGHRAGVKMMSVGKENAAVEQHFEAAFEAWLEPFEIVSSALIDCEEQDEARRRLLGTSVLSGKRQGGES